MKSKWQWVLAILIRRIWFRAAFFCLFSVALALVAAWIAPIIPYDISTKIGAKAVDNILEILGSSMLAVTTFSMTAMVSAFSAATGNISPRATKLLVEDSVAQTALSTFLGAFLFAIVGICALSTGLYGNSGRVVLFAGTVVVIVVIVVTLLRWIQHLSKFGRMGDTIARVERKATAAAHAMGTRPHRGARPPEPPPPPHPFVGEESGYVTHVDVAALERVAHATGTRLSVLAVPGSFVTPVRPLAGGAAAVSERHCKAIIQAFTVDHSRAFEQDPRFGLVVLSEIASRALSPAVNDPGTAIAVLDAGLRVFSALIRADPQEGSPERPDVDVPTIHLADMLEDLFRPIARDGAGTVEVGIRMQRVLGTLRDLAPDAADLFHAVARDARDRAAEALANASDRQALRAVFDRVWVGRAPDAASG